MSADALFDMESWPSPSGDDGLGALSAPRAHITSHVPHPVAHVHVLTTHPHLDRIFDYEVPAKLNEAAQPGVRVTVPLGPHTLEGFLISRDSTTYQGAQLRDIERVISPEPALQANVYELAQAVASSHASTVSGCLRLAIPPRHARAEMEFHTFDAAPHTPRVREVHEDAWQLYRGGDEYLDAVAKGQAPRGAVCTLPGVNSGEALLAPALARVLRGGMGAIVIAPTARSASHLAQSLEEALGVRVALMLSDAPAQDRYTAFLGAMHERARIVVGTRSAIWAPVPRLGLIALMDDSSQHLRERRAPYAHTRDVALERAGREEAAYLALAPYISVEHAALADEGKLTLLEGTGHAKATHTPRVSAAEQWKGGEGDYRRLPQPVFTVVREAVQRGPVLMLVPHSGYVPMVVCASCGQIALCAECGGTLRIEAQNSMPQCHRCGAPRRAFQCRHCGGEKLRAGRIGSARTAEEIGRAFPGIGVTLSSASAHEGIVETVGPARRIVIATPGAEPRAQGGFAAGIILDAPALAREGLGAESQLVRAIARVAERVRPRGEGGHVLIAGGVDAGMVAALTAWEHGAFAARLVRERQELRLPPTTSWFEISGDSCQVRLFLARLRANARAGVDGDTVGEHALFSPGITPLTSDIELLGPSSSGDATTRAYVRTELAKGESLAALLGRTLREHTASGESRLHIEAHPASL